MNLSLNSTLWIVLYSFIDIYRSTLIHLPHLKGMRVSFVFHILGQFEFSIPLLLSLSLTFCLFFFLLLFECLSIGRWVGRSTGRRFRFRRQYAMLILPRSLLCYLFWALTLPLYMWLSVPLCVVCVPVCVSLFVLWVNVRTRLCANCSSAAEVVHSVFILVLCDI